MDTNRHSIIPCIPTVERGRFFVELRMFEARHQHRTKDHMVWSEYIVRSFCRLNWNKSGVDSHPDSPLPSPVRNGLASPYIHQQLSFIVTASIHTTDSLRPSTVIGLPWDISMVQLPYGEGEGGGGDSPLGCAVPLQLVDQQ